MTCIIPSQCHSSLSVTNASGSIHLFEISGGLSPLKVLFIECSIYSKCYLCEQLLYFVMPNQLHGIFYLN